MRRKLLILLPALAFLSCSEDATNEDLNLKVPTEGLEELSANVEVAYPEVRGSLSEVYFAGQKITVEEIYGDFIYEGDIMFPPDMLSAKPTKLVYEQGEIPDNQKSVGRTLAKWPNNTVYYSIDSNLPDQARVWDAIKHWESNTSVKFVQRTTQSNYIYFTPGSGCSSYVGMIGGKQNINLATNCTTGTTIHEIGHAMGLWHEQSRVGRDSDIKIHWENIRTGYEHNFKTYADMGFDGKEFTSNLDFMSIMMYPPYAFSRNREPTISRADGSSYSVQRTSLSSGDKEGINTMYPSSTTTTVVYTNGEFYTISGLTVLRFYDAWYYYGPYGWKKLILKNDVWYYA